MSSFWPDGLKLSDTQSPRDILKTAQEEWYTNSDGIMELVLQDAQSESGNSMIIVHAKHAANKRTAMLFSVVNQPEKSYPVAIQLEEDLPIFLKKSYSEPMPLRPSIASSISAITGQQILKTVVNEWVSDTPSEFREKLTKAFNLGIIKREIVNLASSSTDNLNNTDLDSEM
jgi:hypothetical protein